MLSRYRSPEVPMMNLKSIAETLAPLVGGVALFAAGCASSQAPENATEVPAEPAKQEEAAKEATAGEAAAGESKPEEPAAPVDSAAAPVASASAAAPAASAAAGPAKKPAGPAKKGGTGTAKKKDGKKAGAAGACGEGTCG